MRVLVACEESQTVCKAFRERGHEAFSCDIQECSGGHPEWHICGDALEAINPTLACFITQDGSTHTHTLGSRHRASAVHTSRCFRREAFRTETEGRQSAEGHCVLYADGAGRM